MSIAVYIYSYPKTSVKSSVRTAWNLNKSVSHIDDIFSEVEDDADVLEWSARISFCFEALQILTPKDSKGQYDGDREFSITKEQLITFKKNVEKLDQNEVPRPDWSQSSIHELQMLIDTFDFDDKYLTVHTD